MGKGGGQTEISYIGSSKSDTEKGEILPLDSGHSNA